MTQSKQNFFSWAYDHSNNSHHKYSTNSHALFISASGTILFFFLTFVLRFTLFSYVPADYPMRPESPFVGAFFLLYLCIMVGTRYYENGSVALYEALWACNQCLLISAISLIIQDAFIIRVSLLLISMDQFLWYIDISSFLVKRKFIIGVAKYIIWPETSKLRLATTFHHLWFMPLCIWQIMPSIPYSGFNRDVFMFSCLLCLGLAWIGRMSTPKEINISKKVKEDDKIVTRTVYMNINLSWELWKDVRIGLLEYLYRVMPSQLVVLVLSFFWNVANFMGFLVFSQIQALL